MTNKDHFNYLKTKISLELSGAAQVLQEMAIKLQADIDKAQAQEKTGSWMSLEKLEESRLNCLLVSSIILQKNMEISRSLELQQTQISLLNFLTNDNKDKDHSTADFTND